MPDDQLFEGRLCVFITAQDQSLEELCVRHRPDGSQTEKLVHLPVPPLRWIARHCGCSFRLYAHFGTGGQCTVQPVV